MEIACLDLEGVLIPEIWVGLADRTGIDGLRMTTRDNPDYDDLMRHRLGLVADNGLGMADLQAVVDTLDPLDGAADFLEWLRPRFQVVILSDTFYELAMPLMRKLGHPTLFCHHLEVTADGRLGGYALRLADQKAKAVRAFQALNFKVVATGDSYNDTTMLAAADAGILYRPPENVVREFPDFAVAEDYDALRRAFADAQGRLGAASASR